VKAKLRHTKLIRRLKLPPNFECIQQRLRVTFDIPHDEKMRLCWRDSDGDLVTLGSEAELQDALAVDPQLSKSGVFRIEVKVKNAHDSLCSSSGSSSNNDSDSDDCGAGTGRNAQLHPGVVCDGCQHQLFGYRFKCVVCPDYDLCLRCETRGRHTLHDMLLIRKPLGSGACSSGGLSNVLLLLNQVFNGPLHAEVPQQPPRQAASFAASAHAPSPKNATDPAAKKSASIDLISEPIHDFAAVHPLIAGTVAATESPSAAGAENPLPATSVAAGNAALMATVPSGLEVDQDWNMVNHEEVADVYTPGVSVLSPIVHQSRQQMLAMGFSDELGCLTRLLKLHDGDIGKVLDVIRTDDDNHQRQ